MSNHLPIWPFKSARPRLSTRPVRVTSPVRLTTPKMPSSGRVDTPDGMAAAAPRAISNPDGRIVNLEAAIRQKTPTAGVFMLHLSKHISNLRPAKHSDSRLRVKTAAVHGSGSNLSNSLAFVSPATGLLKFNSAAEKVAHTVVDRTGTERDSAEHGSLSAEAHSSE